MTPAVLSVAAGAAVLILLCADVLLTVFHPEGHGGPVNRWLSRGLWSAGRVIGRWVGERMRPRVLGLCGPLLAVFTVLSWVSLLVVGFALVYLPYMRSFRVDPGALGDPWLEAVYYSGYIASTLGIGDVVATLPALRLLTVLEAIGGFALFAVGVTYVLAVYRELGTAIMLAVDISSRFDRGMRAALGAGGPSEAVPARRWSEGTARRLIRLSQAMSQYPILHYFRPRNPDRALAVQVGHLVALLRSVDAGEVRGAAGRPETDALATAVDAYLAEVNDYFVPARYAPKLPDVDPGSREWRYRRHVRYLGYSRSV